MKKILTTGIMMILTIIFSQSGFAQEPQFEWAAGIGGTSYDEGRSVAVDASGNIYTTGDFQGTADFDPGSGIYNLSASIYGGNDIFISKLDASGNFVWAKSMGGSNSSAWGISIALDASGNVYTTGSFTGTADFDPGSGIYNLTSNGSDDIFISKLDASGNFVWAKSMGAGSWDFGYSITLDAAGNVYTTGGFRWTVDFDPGSGTYNLSSNQYYDIFISKLDTSGNFVWAKSMGNSGTNKGNSIALDASGNIYTTGSFTGTVDFDPDTATYNLTSNGNAEIFISKLDASGNFVWAKNMGGSSYEYGNSIAVDASGNVYTTGYFADTADFDPGTGTYNLSTNGVSDIFISKLDASGNFVWAKKMGASGDDRGFSIALDASGNVYTIGRFQDTVDFDPGSGIYNLSQNGGGDIFISKLNASGNFVWAKNIEAYSSYVGNSIALDASSNVYTTGYFQNTVDFDPGSGTYNLSSYGYNDIFILKLSQPQSQPLQANFTTSDTIAIVGDTILFTDQSTGIPTSWLWNFGDGSSDTLQNPTHIYQAAGTYTVSLVVSDGTSSDTLEMLDYITVNLLSSLAVVYSSSNVSCFEFSDGAIDLTISGGVTPYSYSWSNGSYTQDISALTAGVYTVTITDNNSNILIESYTITEPTAISLGTEIYSFDFDALTTGLGVVAQIGSPWTTWSNLPAEDPIISNTVSVSGNNSIEIVTDKDLILLTNDLTTGRHELQFKIWVVNGSPAYFNLLQDFDGSNQVWGMHVFFNENGTGIVDANGTGTGQFTYTHNTWINIKVIIDLDSDFATLNINNNNVISCIWSLGASGNGNLAKLDAINFYGWTDNLGNGSNYYIDDVQFVQQNAAVNNISCNGGNNGSIDITVTGGTTPYSYLWNTSANTEDINGLTTGNYTVTITDVNACTTNENYTIFEPDSISLNAVVVDETCTGCSNGAIYLSVSGGTPSYTYLWSNGETTQDLMNLSAGTYNVTVNDANACTISGYWDILVQQNDTIFVKQDGTGDAITIQGGINLAQNGDIVLVYPDTYMENINLNGKSIILASRYLTNPNSAYISQTIIDGMQNSNVVVLNNGEDYTTVIKGFTIRNGNSNSGGGIYINGANPLIDHCVIVNNTATTTGGGINVSNSTGIRLVHCTLTGNTAQYGGAIMVTSTNIYIENSIIWDNLPHEMYFNNYYNPNTLSISHTDLMGGVSGIYTGNWSITADTGVINTNPIFVDAANGNYNLMVNSPCIDAGSTTSPVDPDGTTADMGAFYFEQNQLLAQFASNIQTGTAPLQVQFTDLSTGNLTSWLWDLGDGGTSSDQNPTHIYQTAGIYTVSLIVSDGVNIDTLTLNNYILVSEYNSNPYYTRLPLVEHFSSGSSVCPPCCSSEQPFQDVITPLLDSCTVIRYPSYWITDGYQTLESEERYYYYSVPGIPNAVLNGGSSVHSMIITDSLITNSYYNDSTTVILDAWYQVNGTQVDININIESSLSISNPNLVLQVAIVENETFNNVTCSQVNNSLFVMKKMLPNELGTAIPLLISNTTNSYSFSYTFPVINTVEEFTDLSVVVFVQDYVSHEIYQSAWAESTTTTQLNADFIADVVTGDAPLTVTFTDLSTGNPINWLWDFGDGGAGLSQSPVYIYQTPGLYTVSLIVSDATTSDTLIMTDLIEVTTPQISTPNWYITNTGTSHTILIQNTTPVTIDGIQISTGDYIGVFYDSLGTLACAGFEEWIGQGLAITAWGDDSQTTQPDGFISGEAFTWIIWRAADDSEFIATADYMQPPVMPNAGFYVANGMSGLTSLEAFTIEYQYINLPQGWSFFSSYIDPFIANIDSICTPFVNEVIIAKDGDGNTYWPQWGINFIGNILLGDGYQIKVTTTQTMIVAGLSVQPENTPVTIDQGWSFLGYLRQNPAPIDSMLSAVVSEVIIVKSGAGQTYWPQWGINMIGNMNPGEGYLIKMNSQQTINYPANSVIYTKYEVINPKPLRFKNVRNSGENMTLGIPLSSWNIPPNNESEIGIFTQSGLLIGSCVYANDNMAISIWGNDELNNEIDGLLQNEEFDILIWDKETRKEQKLIIDDWLTGDNIYKTNKISVINKIQYSSLINNQSFILYQNIPNPFNNETKFSFYLPEKAYIEFSILNILGEIIEVLVSDDLDTGNHSIIYNSRGLPVGTYYYRLKTNNFTQTKKMVVIGR